MRLYIKQIRPVYYRSSGHGFIEIREPLTDEWFDEREKDELIKIYNPKVEYKDPYGILEFDERYIPIEVETPLKISDETIDEVIDEILGCN
jgi:hypothetical protein